MLLCVCGVTAVYPHDAGPDGSKNSTPCCPLILCLPSCSSCGLDHKTRGDGPHHACRCNRYRHKITPPGPIFNAIAAPTARSVFKPEKGGVGSWEDIVDTRAFQKDVVRFWNHTRRAEKPSFENLAGDGWVFFLSLRVMYDSATRLWHVGAAFGASTPERF